MSRAIRNNYSECRKSLFCKEMGVMSQINRHLIERSERKGSRQSLRYSPVIHVSIYCLQVPKRSANIRAVSQPHGREGTGAMKFRIGAFGYEVQRRYKLRDDSRITRAGLSAKCHQWRHLDHRRGYHRHNEGLHPVGEAGDSEMGLGLAPDRRNGHAIVRRANEVNSLMPIRVVKLDVRRVAARRRKVGHVAR